MKHVSGIFKSDLEVFIVTYNRSHFLARTLEHLDQSIINEYKVTVLDNCSSDDTSIICRKFENRRRNFIYIKHKTNIGACANILRAIEMSASTYTWILCDDDLIDLSHFDDVLQIIEEGQVNLIHVGGHPENEWTEGGKTDNPQKLFNRGYPFFKFSSFLPANIFNTKKFQSEHLLHGYENIANGYPHMPYLLTMYQKKELMYVAKNRIITASLNGQFYDSNTWFFWWMNTCKLLTDKIDVRKAFFSHWKNEEYSEPMLSLINFYLHYPGKKNEISYFINTFCTREERILFKNKVFKQNLKESIKRTYLGKKIHFIKNRIFHFSSQET